MPVDIGGFTEDEIVPLLSKKLQELVDIVGIGGVDELLMRQGGKKIYIGATSRNKKNFAFLDPIALQKLRERFAGTWLAIPKRDNAFRILRNKQIFDLAIAGASSVEIARRVGLSARRVNVILMGGYPGA
ncbi:MAG: hypothetical protein HQL56_01030 [Magnetococcales bacterium]|nr:hypothetical protein [Magnetococcales bacterium]